MVHVARSRRANLNQVQCGDACQGLRATATAWFISSGRGGWNNYLTRTGGKDRDMVFCMNTLSGVGAGKSQFHVPNLNKPDGARRCNPYKFVSRRNGLGSTSVTGVPALLQNLVAEVPATQETPAEENDSDSGNGSDSETCITPIAREYTEDTPFPKGQEIVVSFGKRLSELVGMDGLPSTYYQPNDFNMVSVEIGDKKYSNVQGSIGDETHPGSQKVLDGQGNKLISINELGKITIYTNNTEFTSGAQVNVTFEVRNPGCTDKTDTGNIKFSIASDSSY